MKQFQHLYSDNSVIGQCLMLAHATFYDALPSNVQHKSPTAPEALPAKRAPVTGALQRWMDALDTWANRQRVKQREAYLAQAQDIFDVERRMQDLARRPYY